MVKGSPSIIVFIYLIDSENYSDRRKYLFLYNNSLSTLESLFDIIVFRYRSLLSYFQI